MIIQADAKADAAADEENPATTTAASAWVGFPLAVRRFRGAAGPVFGVSVPVAVPPSLRLAPPAVLPAPVAWARAA